MRLDIHIAAQRSLWAFFSSLLALRERLDTIGVGEVEVKFTGHTVPRGKPLLLDMSEMTYVSSLGLRMLLTVAKALGRRGAKTVLLPAAAECA